jgi:Bax protein
MTTYEKGALVVVGALVAFVAAAAAVQPPASATASPRAVLALRATIPMPPPLIRPKLRSAERGHFVFPTATKLNDSFTQIGYDLDSVVSGDSRVPRVFLGSIPPDMDEIAPVEVRKSVFFKSVLPLILQVNEQIISDRHRIWTLRHRVATGNRLDALERLWLVALANRYGVERDDFEALLERVDIIPPSLALAQSAEESGWGTSRFVREGNALFGQWVFGADDHLIPGRRDAGKHHKIKAFDNLLHSVRAYAHNLNTHSAYGRFRSGRAAARADGRPLDGLALAATMMRYSERGEAYIHSIRTIIRANDLSRLDDARLHENAVESPI